MAREQNVHIMSAGDVARNAADRFVSIAETAMVLHNRFTVALSGGSTPWDMYRLLATREYSPRVDWSRVHVFWGDERCVPPDSSESNYRMANEAVLTHVPITVTNIHRMHGELDPQVAAARYERTLRQFFNIEPGRDQFPRFDLVLLGMGNDGHTASLFPNSPALAEREKWVTATFVEELDAWRLTLTLPVINAAANILFLVTGASKAARLKEVLENEGNVPVQQVQPVNGRLEWLLDAAAASMLTKRES